MLGSGIPAVELFINRQHLDYLNHAQIHEIAAWFRDAKLQLWALHSPMYSDDQNGRSGPNAVIAINEPQKNKRVVMVDEIKRALEIAETIPCRYLIQHLGVPDEEFDERQDGRGVLFARRIELVRPPAWRRDSARDIPERLLNGGQAELLHQRHPPEQRLLLRHWACADSSAPDRGHAEGEFDLMRARIRSTHIHDNDGTQDNHRFPYLHPGGTIDWRRMMELLREAELPLNLELKESDDFPQPLDSVRAVFEKLESV